MIDGMINGFVDRYVDWQVDGCAMKLITLIEHQGNVMNKCRAECVVGPHIKWNVIKVVV